MHNDTSAAEQYPLDSSYGAPYPSGIAAAAVAAGSASPLSGSQYTLDAFDMMKRSSAQAYDNGQAADAAAKKARYNDAANYAAAGGFNNGYGASLSAGVAGSFTQQQQQQQQAFNGAVAATAAALNGQGRAFVSGGAGQLGQGTGQQFVQTSLAGAGAFGSPPSPFVGTAGGGGGGLPAPISIPTSTALYGQQGPHTALPSFSAAGLAPNSPFPGLGASPATAGIYGAFPTSPFTPGGFGGLGAMGLAASQHIGVNQQSGRTVYVGNLPADASVDELLNLVKMGPIENVRILPEKNCAFISFLDAGTAAAFHADACVKKVTLHGQELKIGWGKPSAVPGQVLLAVQQSAATRNVYLGNLDEDTTEQSLRDDLARFGPIDQVKIVRDKNIGFVHFLSISTAMKVVSTLPTEPTWTGKRVNYGKDRCAYVPKSQQQNQAHNNQAAAMGMAAAASLGYPATPFSATFGRFPMSPTSFGAESFMGLDDQRSPASSVFGPAAAMMGAGQAAMGQMGNRTVYLGNIHPDTTTEEICNVIRGGILQNIRYIPEKHIAFVTFVDANAALAFFHLASYQGIMIHNRRLKIGWGKHSGPLSPAIAMAVQAGGSRNVYVGNIDNPEELTEDKLRRDFGEYGDVELVNSLREKNCAFVNFTNISNAIKAIEGMKNHPDYQKTKISYGKDRCGNAPRTMSQSRGARNVSVGGGPAGAGAGAAAGVVVPVDPAASVAAPQDGQPIVAVGGEVEGVEAVEGIEGADDAAVVADPSAAAEGA